MPGNVHRLDDYPDPQGAPGMQDAGVGYGPGAAAKMPFWNFIITLQAPSMNPCSAVLCLFLNFFISGTGTLISACSPAAAGYRSYICAIAALQFFFMWLILPWWWSIAYGIRLVFVARRTQNVMV